MKLNDKTVLKQLRVDIDTALIPLKEKYNLQKLDAGNIRYEGDGQSAKIQLNAETYLDAGQKSREEIAFENYAEFYGIAKDALGKQFQMNGHRVQIVGFDSKRRKYPIIVKDLAGLRRLTTTDVVARHFPVS